jgi:membrane peptidoglycan carboxypeptidase
VRINYPRADREGWRRFIPSWKLVLGSLASLVAAGAVLGGALFAWVYFTTDIPEPNEVAEAQTSIVYWNDGETELARLGDTNRISVPLSDVPEDVRYAVLSAEDRNFYEHNGFDVTGILRALWNNLTSDSTSGGSTITQQLAKNAFLTSEQTYLRKFNEAVLTVKLEVEMTKDEILEDYLNVIYYGRSAYGIQTASEAYFQTVAKDLTLEQGAVLASVINAPGLYNPDDPDGLTNLQNRYAYVLNGMVEEGWLTAEERDEALEDFPEIAERRRDQKYAGPKGFLIRTVQDELLTMGFTEQEVNAGGLRIVSTFSEQAQAAAEEAVRVEAPTTGMDGVRIGLAAVEPVTGEAVAMYGGRDYLEDSFNNATQATYQAGSTFKPFALAAATEEGIGLDSLWPGNTGYQVGDYTVNNYADNSYGEWITLLKGTEQSVNTVYVPLTDEVGPDRVQDAALRAGIPEDTAGMEEPPDVTFALGTDSPHTIDVADSYATFAARGERFESWTSIRRVGTAGGGLLYERENDTRRTFDEGTADVVNFALQSVVQNGTGAPARALGRPAAAKTGSTDDYKSAWFAGYVPQLAAAVSFSKSGPNGEELSLSGTGGQEQFYGSGYPARIWTAFMEAALAGTEAQDFVDPVDPPSGGGLSSPTPTPTESPTPEPTTESPTPEPTAESPTPEPTAESPTPEPTAEPPTPEPGGPTDGAGGQGPQGEGPPGQASPSPTL